MRSFGLSAILTLLPSLVSCTASTGGPADTDPHSTSQGNEDSATHLDTHSTSETGSVSDTGSPGSDPPTNLLLNESFEDGEEPWSIWGGAERIEGHAVQGEWSLRATRVSGAEQLVEGLSPDTTYRLSGWGKTEDSSPMTIGVKDHGSEELSARFKSADYTEESLSFTTGFGATSATIYAYKHSGDAAGYADSLSLVLESESSAVLIWSDEFEGEGVLDSSRWTFEEGFIRNEELQWYQQENAFQEDGMLVIEGRTEDRLSPSYVPGSSAWQTQRETIEYTSASVTTEDLFEWQTGRLVVRAKVSNLAGTWPAIWTLGTDCEWPSNGEVDVMENYGGDILANFAWGTDTRWSAQWDAAHWPVSDFGEGWTDEFHVWELDWTETSMTIYLDGTVLNTVSLTDTVNGSAACEGQNPFQQPHYLLLNLALGGAGGSVDGLSFPTRYLIDYVRIYQ
jgi:beta-glucanase (GH16 family)